MEKTKDQIKDLIWECIYCVDNATYKIGLAKLTHEELEELITCVYDKLQTIVDEDIPWWDKPDESELAEFRVELAR